ncbi:MAG: RpiB/LacA/LacB family sugar-phosphate isomerase [Bacteroidales bacterium]|nr:RpiB/LacA/LacB family sugar-phosphate isomerase [Bacteroidales bacterium]
MKRVLAIASDHAGYQMKLSIIKYLEEKGYDVTDLGTDSINAVNYPDFGHPLAEAVESGKFSLGISLCGSGNGINMVTNKHQGIRGALCWNREISHLARSHNDANICSMPARYIDMETAREIVDAFLGTDYEGGRHDIRINNIPIRK